MSNMESAIRLILSNFEVDLSSAIIEVDNGKRSIKFENSQMAKVINEHSDLLEKYYHAYVLPSKQLAEEMETANPGYGGLTQLKAKYHNHKTIYENYRALLNTLSEFVLTHAFYILSVRGIVTIANEFSISNENGEYLPGKKLFDEQVKAMETIFSIVKSLNTFYKK